MTDEKLFETDLANRVYSHLEGRLETIRFKMDPVNYFKWIINITQIAIDIDTTVFTSTLKYQLGTDTDTKKEHWPKQCQNRKCAICGETLEKCVLYKDGTVEGWCPYCEEYQRGRRG